MVRFSVFSVCLAAAVLGSAGAFAEQKPLPGTAVSFDACTSRSCCEKMAESCLFNCSGLDPAKSDYGQCVIMCDRRRSQCLRRMSLQKTAPQLNDAPALDLKMSD